jgi:DNA helicase IV
MVVRTYIKKPLSYACIVIDEFQNYTEYELAPFQSMVEHATQSIIFVGDFLQQTRFFLPTKDQYKKHIHPDRFIEIEKSYRNTKEIISYLVSQNLLVAETFSEKSGDKVLEKECVKENLIKELEIYITTYEKEGTIGIICEDKHLCEFLKGQILPHEAVHILDIEDAQGIEFDTAICILEKDMTLDTFEDSDFAAEYLKIKKQKRYIAFTRGVSRLVVIRIKI